MNGTQLRPYQIEAIEAMKTAWNHGQKHMIIEMPTGCRKNIILNKILEHILSSEIRKILVVTSLTLIKDNLIRDLFTSNLLRDQLDRNIIVKTEREILEQPHDKTGEQPVIVFYENSMIEKLYEILFCQEKNVIVFTTIENENVYKKFNCEQIVFSYTYQQAVDDGYLTPAMDPNALEPAMESFCKQLLKNFGYHPIPKIANISSQDWDFIVKKDHQNIYVEYKAFKSEFVPTSIAQSLLNTVVKKKVKQLVLSKDPNNLVLLIVLNKLPDSQKYELYDKNKIIIWDIENLVFYCNNNPILLKQLSQITYFPIENLEGKPFKRTDISQLFTIIPSDISNDQNDPCEARELLKEFRSCTSGRPDFGRYEDVCEKILRYLFEANHFNRLTAQHKTNDEHFRMDLIGSLKINQNNGESMHPFWKMLVEHFKSHFVVFEFKNYTKEIDQNLIYITEKYLFASALRNVAFIVSRKGFSNSAKFAAEGCLKEHGKLILDVTEDDLIKMLESPNDNPSDHLLTKLEDFLMGISK